MRQLTGCRGLRAGTGFSLTEDSITVGAAADNIIVVTGVGVAAHQALLLRDGTEYRVCDLGAPSGTRVNGTAVTERVLAPGDLVTWGTVELRYEAARAEGRAPELASERSRWIGVTVLAAVVSAGVTFLLTSRVPNRAAELAAPVTAVASVPAESARLPVARTQSYRDPGGRFSCEVPAGWRITGSNTTTRSVATFAWGDDEIRVSAQAARGAIDADQTVAAVRDFGTVTLAGWRQLGAERALQVELTTVHEPVAQVRLVKFQRSEQEHTVALYATSAGERERLVGQFEDFLKSYRTQ